MSNGSEYLTSNAAIAYPFREDAPGLSYSNVAVHGTPATLPIEAIVDAVAFVPDTVNELYLKSITQAAYLFSVVFVDAYDTPVISGSFDPLMLNVGGNYNAAYGVLTIIDTTTDYQVKLVVNTAPFQAYLAGCTADVFAMTLPLEYRTLNRKRPRVETFELYTSLPPIPAPYTPGPISGKVMFIDGYNTVLSPAVSEDDLTALTLDLSAGGGEGLYPCTPTTAVIYKRFMGLVPDNSGNINIVPGDERCYSVVPAGDSVTFQIHGTCVACCSCEDYANVAKAVKRLLNYTDLVRMKMGDAHATYEQGVTVFNAPAGIAPKYIGPKLFLSGFSGSKIIKDPKLGKYGSPEYATITAELRNNSAYAFTLFSFDFTSLTPAYTIRSIHWSCDGDGGQVDKLTDLKYPLIPTIERGRYLVLCIRIRIDGPLPIPETPPTWSGWAEAVTDVAGTVGAGIYF